MPVCVNIAAMARVLEKFETLMNGPLLMRAAIVMTALDTAGSRLRAPGGGAS